MKIEPVSALSFSDVSRWRCRRLSALVVEGLCWGRRFGGWTSVSGSSLDG